MVRREEEIHSNESGDNMHKWNEITDENSLKEFMERVSFFHDSCIKEMHYLSGAYVNENLDMYPVNDRRILRVIIQRQYEEDSMIEMEFQGLKYLKLFPADERYSCEILDSNIILKEDCIIWSDCEDKTELELWYVHLNFDGVRFSDIWERRIIGRCALSHISFDPRGV